MDENIQKLYKLCSFCGHALNLKFLRRIQENFFSAHQFCDVNVTRKVAYRVSQVSCNSKFFSYTKLTNQSFKSNCTLSAHYLIEKSVDEEPDWVSNGFSFSDNLIEKPIDWFQGTVTQNWISLSFGALLLKVGLSSFRRIESIMCWKWFDFNDWEHSSIKWIDWSIGCTDWRTSKMCCNSKIWLFHSLGSKFWAFLTTQQIENQFISG